MAHSVSVGLISKQKAWVALALCSVYLCLHYLQYHGIGPEWLRFYAKDVLLVPALLLASEITGRLVNRRIRIRLKEVGMCLLYAILAFEWVLPYAGLAAAGDVFDVLAYVVGTSVYVTSLFWKNWPK